MEFMYCRICNLIDTQELEQLWSFMSFRCFPHASTCIYILHFKSLKFPLSTSWGDIFTNLDSNGLHRACSSLKTAFNEFLFKQVPLYKWLSPVNCMVKIDALIIKNSPLAQGKLNLGIRKWLNFLISLVCWLLTSFTVCVKLTPLLLAFAMIFLHFCITFHPGFAIFQILIRK